ncbi:MAG: hypothetical protein AAFN94_00835 [Pseudomonadota bacterium]
MSATRTALRTEMRAGLEAALPDVNWPKKHWRAVDESSLPRGSVMVQRFDSTPLDRDTSLRRYDVVAKIERGVAGDLEDLMDADGTALEHHGLTILADLFEDCEVGAGEYYIDAAGDPPVGTTALLFRVITRDAEIPPNS